MALFGFPFYRFVRSHITSNTTLRICWAFSAAKSDPQYAIRDPFLIILDSFVVGQFWRSAGSAPAPRVRSATVAGINEICSSRTMAHDEGAHSHMLPTRASRIRGTLLRRKASRTRPSGRLCGRHESVIIEVPSTRNNQLFGAGRQPKRATQVTDAPCSMIDIDVGGSTFDVDDAVETKVP